MRSTGWSDRWLIPRVENISYWAVGRQVNLQPCQWVKRSLKKRRGVLKTRKLVGVIGTGNEEALAIRLAEEVGLELARRGVSLVCGGLGGVMGAASCGLRRGRAEFGGDSLAVGLLPGDSPENANPCLDLVLPTGLGIGRNLLIVRAAQAVIAISGGSGTLSEMAFAWQLGKPIIALVPSGGVSEKHAGLVLDNRRETPVIPAYTGEEAVELALQEMGVNCG